MKFTLLDLLWDSVVSGLLFGSSLTGCTLRRLLDLRYMAVYRMDGRMAPVKLKNSSIIIITTKYPRFNVDKFIANEHPGCDISKPIALAKWSIIEIMSENTHDDTKIPAKILRG